MASNVNKKAAHAGQWQTPPTMPRYPTLPSLNSSQSQSQAAMRSIAASPSQQEELVDLPPAPDKLPDTSEEYAKALQEAYRKGAAAAIKAQQDRIPTATSCPNFSTSLATSSGGINLPGHEIRIPTVDEEFSVSDAVSNLDHKILSSSVPDRSLMPPPPPHSSAVPVCIHSQQQNSVRGSDHQRSDLNPQMAQDNSPFSMYKCTDDGNCSNMNFALEETETETTINKNVPKKSLSMPDMTTYTKEAEEEKRLKRLARNRASARQRRLRKKNLVDAYEAEVAILEKTIAQLKAHKWGESSDHSSLIQALTMERGQEELSAERRAMVIQDIIKQQMKQVDMLQEAQREQQFLSLLVSREENQNGDGNDDDDKMFFELQNILNLTPEQKQRMRESFSTGLDKEVEALNTVSASLKAMQENDWLLNEGVQKITNEFTGILNKNQKAKLFMWTDSNAEAIDQLDYVEGHPLQNGPIFNFGSEASAGADYE